MKKLFFYIKAYFILFIWLLFFNKNIKFLIKHEVYVWNIMRHAFNYYLFLCTKNNIQVPYSYHRYWLEHVQDVPIQLSDVEWTNNLKPKNYQWGDFKLFFNKKQINQKFN